MSGLNGQTQTLVYFLLNYLNPTVGLVHMTQTGVETALHFLE